MTGSWSPAGLPPLDEGLAAGVEKGGGDLGPPFSRGAIHGVGNSPNSKVIWVSLYGPRIGSMFARDHNTSRDYVCDRREACWRVGQTFVHLEDLGRCLTV